MIYQRPWHPLALVLLALSMALHLFSLVVYVRLPLSFAAYTVFPIWVWGIVGVVMSAICFLFYHNRFALFIVLIWTLTILIISDEARALGRIGVEAPKPGTPKEYAESKVTRVVTFNCARQTNPIATLKAYQPDIVFLQEIPHAYHIKQIIDELYQGQGDYRYNTGKGCAVIVRGVIESEIKIPKFRNQLLKVQLASGKRIEILNIHLRSAATNLRFWERSCWHEHSQNRLTRLFEMTVALENLKQKSSYPGNPALIAGDFNAPANDAVHRLIERDFTNAFTQVGTGWSNTYHRSLPLLRIDHIYSSRDLIPVRCRAVKAEKSDHRMVIADFIFR